MTSSVPLQITPGFAVPLVHARHPDPMRLNARLRALLLAREAEGDRHRNPDSTMNIGPALFESHFQIFEWPEPCVRELRDFCWAVLMRTVAELNGYDAAVLRRLRIHASSWFHVTRKGGWFGLHNHPMASWSGVYCVDPGTGAGEAGEAGGQLSFLNPNPQASMFVDKGIVQMKPPYGIGGREFQLEAGQLVLFPSWLQHQVHPFQGAGARITVAFNAWFRME